MICPDELGSPAVARGDAAPQTGAARRTRGPHPLPEFLRLATEACGGDRAHIARVLAGVRRYQAHPAVRALPEPPVVARAGAARLLDYDGDGPPVVFVPSLVNPPTVLDLAEGRSLLRWLSGQGVRPLLIDWGSVPHGGDLAAHVDEVVAPLVAAVGEPAALAGYCLGGTLALRAAATLPVTALALIATPWDFAGYTAERRAGVASAWAMLKPMAEELGAVPMDLLQPLFWAMDPAGTVAKFTNLAHMNDEDVAAFAALEDWANDGPPLGLAAATHCFENLFDANDSGKGRFGVDPASLTMPVLNIVSTRDRIVPAAAAPDVGTRLDLDLGHVGMIVGGRAKVALWEPLARFLSQPHKIK
jgi:polyhydroxyalkanoate synthase subunit PhaC